MKHLSNTQIEEIYMALGYAMTYIDYVKTKDPTLHQEANGNPSAEDAIKETLNRIRTIHAKS